MTRYSTESPYIPIQHGMDTQLEVQFFWDLGLAQAIRATFSEAGCSDSTWTFGFSLLSNAIGRPESLSGLGEIQFRYTDFGLVIFLYPRNGVAKIMHIEEHYVTVYLKPWLVDTFELWDKQAVNAQLAMEQSVDRALTMIFEGSN